MRWKLAIRKIHRRLSLILGIQFLFWTVSGAYFSLVHLKKVRGEDRLVDQSKPLLPLDSVVAPPANLLRLEADLLEIKLRRNDQDRLVYEAYREPKVPFAVFDALNGERLPQRTSQEIVAIAMADSHGDHAIESVLLLEEAPAEYKGPLPVYQVSIKDGRATRLYLSPISGQVLSRRNRYWRVFDFLWMLHIMDFDQRENFNNPLLRVTATVSILVSLSGFLLWATSRRWRRRRRKNS